jgi:hypothetical protein
MSFSICEPLLVWMLSENFDIRDDLFSSTCCSSSSRRALRASARNLSGTQLSPDPPILMDVSTSSAPQLTDIDSSKLLSDTEETSNLGLNMPESNPIGVDGNYIPVRKDKGKGKETGARVKEEPSGFLLQQSEPAPSLVRALFLFLCL